MKWEVRTMRFGTSFFDKTIFKKTILRFWPLWGAYSAIWLVALPLNGLVELRRDAYELFIGQRNIERFAQTRVPNTLSFALPLAVVFGVLCAMAVFSHLYNARSANFFGSLPVRREGLFLTHYLAGLSFFLVPNLAAFLLTLLVEAAGGAVFWPGLLFWLAAICGECFFFYSLAVFCAMFTGHILALPAFYAIVNVLAFGVTGLLDVVFRGFYYGFDGFSDGVQAVVKWLTPAVWLNDSLRPGWSVSVVYPRADLSPGDLDYIAQQGGIWISDNTYVIFRGLGTVGAYAVAALLMAAGAFFLYRARRLESAGDVVSVKAMRPVFLYGVAFCVGLAFGMGTIMLLGGGEVTLMLSILIWGVIGYFAARMLLDKTFRVFKKWRGALAVAAVFTALFAVVAFDLTGYETRVPNPDTVDSVHVSGLNAAVLKDYGDNMSMDLSDPELIRLVTVLHQAAVEQRDGEGTSQTHSDILGVSMELTYTLKGGGTLPRRYTLFVNPAEADAEGTAAWALQRIYDDRELYWRVYTFDTLEELLAQGGTLAYVSYERLNGDTGQQETAAYTGQDGLALLAAVKEDFFAGRIGVRRLDDRASWYAAGPAESLSFAVAGLMGGSGWYVTIALQDTASNTLALLDTLPEPAGSAGGLPDTQTG